MSIEDHLPVINSGNTSSAGLTRRQVVQRLLAGVGAGAAWPLIAPGHPICELLRNDAILDEAEKLAEANWKPVFLSPQQNETLIAIAESIVPGSTKARVSRFIDLLLSVDKAEHQRNFVESLSALNREAVKRFSKAFPALDEKQKNVLLTDASTKPPNPEDSKPRTGGKQILYGHFENLKGWISGAYYSSEMGMQELGWTGNYAFEKFPGCEHPGEHH